MSNRDGGYKPAEFEKKWQKRWQEEDVYKTPTKVDPKQKFYCLDMFPYPSGAGLHVGHVEGYTATDIYSRYMRMRGFQVLHPMGWDAFGLPAENYAVKTGIHPKTTTEAAIKTFTSQINSLGLSYDWDREIGTHRPDYYKWTQWFFLLLYKKGLAYKKTAPVNWCPSCQTVLANEQVVDGKCERCDAEVSQKDMDQWFLKITAYADRLLKDLDKIDWPESTKEGQRNWIGRSEGAIIKFEIFNLKFENSKEGNYIEVFTTRPDTVFGATYLVLAPEHPLVDKITTNEYKQEVKKYQEQTKKKTALQRSALEKDKTGVFTGSYAVNPVNGKKIPIWIADYVMMTYGTGAIMAVPAHDQRDLEFALKYGLEVAEVVVPKAAKYIVIEKSLEGDVEKLLAKYGQVRITKEEDDWGKFFEVSVAYEKEEEFIEFLKANLLEESDDGGSWYADSAGTTNKVVFRGKVFNILNKAGFKAFKDYGRQAGIPEDQLAIEPKAYTADGVNVNSDFLNGLETPKAKEAIIKWLEEKGLGKRQVTYKLRDWLISRQRYWGAPIPIIYCTNCGSKDKPAIVPVPEKDLPVKLPDDVDFKPTGESPLKYSKTFHDVACPVCGAKGEGVVWRESDTMDTFVDSSWYFFRFTDPKNDKEFASKQAIKTWMPVDLYVGGAEHTVLHLLYSRFFTKVLKDEGYIDFDEPFMKLRHQGLILAEDGRKMSKRWGNVINPDDEVKRFGADTVRMYEMFMGPLKDAKPWSTAGERGVYRFLRKVWVLQDKVADQKPSEEEERIINKLIAYAGKGIETLSMNTVIARFMEFANYYTKQKEVPLSVWRRFLVIMAPFAPHITEELWSRVGGEFSIHQQPWPEYDANMVKDEQVEMAVAFNGKTRGIITMPADASEEMVLEMVKQTPKFDKYLKGKVQKIIFVKNKIINILVE
ncbi:MAG: leucine--tRNA ligase [bacterium]|nr:leucine--tRNA ligase [bacterium]